MQQQQKQQEMIRLTKRMSELNIASRREAERWIQEGRVYIGVVEAEDITKNNNNMIEPLQKTTTTTIPATIGMKVHVDFKDIHVIGLNNNDDSNNNPLRSGVVLYKPKGFVSSQPDHDDDVPAVRLLTKQNEWIKTIEEESEEEESSSSPSRQKKKKNNNKKSIVDIDPAKYNNKDQNSPFYDQTLQGYVVAGRLDRESSGLLIFTKHGGILAKKLLEKGSSSSLQKEYLVTVEPAHQLTKLEREKWGVTSLPKPPITNLSILRKGGATLSGDTMPLLPVSVKWIRNNNDDEQRRHGRNKKNSRQPLQRQLRFILKEGRKHQIRRMCRELLGWNVVALHRDRIGPIRLDDEQQPPGTWRHLTQSEIQSIINGGSTKKKNTMKKKEPLYTSSIVSE